MTVGEWIRYHAKDEDTIVVIKYDENERMEFCAMSQAKFVRRNNSGLSIGLCHAELCDNVLVEPDKKNRYMLMSPDGCACMCDKPWDVKEL